MECTICGESCITAIVCGNYVPFCQKCHYFVDDQVETVQGIEYSMDAKELCKYTYNDLLHFNRLELVAFLKVARTTRGRAFDEKNQSAIDSWIWMCKMIEKVLTNQFGWVPKRITQKTLTKLSRP